MIQVTVLAWDGKFLAADRQATFGGTPVPATKIFRHNDELIGGSGNIQECIAFVEWYTSGCPTPKPVFSEGFGAYVIKNGQLWKYESLLVPFVMDMPFWAAGCGADYAMGAMAAGKSAAEAVEIACRFDTGCGLGVDILEFEG
jgi:ATP-dependent protease HslVU (ClpYQ) peptidase subunit